MTTTSGTNPFTNRVGQDEPEQVREDPTAEAGPDPVFGTGVEGQGPRIPLAARADAEPAAALPLGEGGGTAAVQVVGCHGGAGVTTLVDLLGHDVAQDAGREWPRPHLWVPESSAAQVLLVARSHRVGLQTIREVLTSWHATGYREGLALLGVILIDDAARVTKEQVTEIKALVAMAPRGWHLPWQESLRMTEPTEASVSARGKWTLKRVRNRAARTRGDITQEKEQER